MAENLDQLVQQGDLPNSPKMIQAIQKGELPLSEALAFWKGKKSEGSPAPVEAPQKPQSAFQKKDVADLKAQGNESIDALVAQGKILNSPKIIEAVKSGKLPMDAAVAFTEQKKQGIVTTSDQGFNQVKDLKTSTEQSKSLQNIANQKTSELSTYDKLAQAWDKTAKTAAHVGEAYAYTANNFGGFWKSLPDRVKVNNFFLQKLASNVTLGIVPEPDTTGISQDIQSVANVGAILGGLAIGLPGTSFISKLPLISTVAKSTNVARETVQSLKVLKTTAKAAGNIEAAGQISKQLLGQRLKGAVLSTIQTGIEGSLIGGVTGTIKGGVKMATDDTGEYSFKDLVAQGISDALVFGAGAMALQPVAVGFGKLGGLKVRPAGKEGPLLGNPQELRAKVAAQAVAKDEVAQRLSKSATVNEVVATLDAGAKAGTLTKEQNQAYNTFNKLKGLAPDIAPELGILANPALLKQTGEAELRKIGQDIFNNPDTVIGQLVEATPALKKLVDAGLWTDAYAATSNLLRNQIKNSKDALSYMQIPLVSTSETMNKLISERVVSRKQGQYPNLNQGLVMDYLTTKTPEALKALKEAGGSGILRTIGSKGVQNRRLNKEEANGIIDDLLSAGFKAVSNTLDFKDLSKLADVNQVLKTATTFNQNLHQTLLDSYKNAEDGMFVYADADTLPSLQGALKLKSATEEQSFLALKRLEISKQMRTLKADPKFSTDPELKSQFTTLKHQMTENSQRASQLQSTVNKESTAYETLDPALKSRVDTVLDTVYVPSKTSDFTPLENKDVGRIFGGDDNPYFIKKDSGLANLMDAMLVSGRDIADNVNKAFGVPFLNTANVWRKLSKEFGPNNPVWDSIGNSLHVREMKIDQERQVLEKQLSSIGIKANTQESALMQRFVEKRLNQTSDEWINLPEKTKQKIQAGAPILRGMYDDLFGRINTVMKSLNFPTVAKREDYITHFQESQNILSEVIGTLLKKGDLSKLEQDFNTRVIRTELPLKSKDAKTRFQYEFKRTGGEFKDDAIGAFLKYVEPALKRIHMSDLVREIDVSMRFAPNNLRTFLDTFKDRYLLDKPEFLDTQITGTANKVINKVKQKLGESAILFNLNNWAQQAATYPLNFSLGAKEAVHALSYQFTKEGREVAALSRNLSMRDISKMEGFEGREFNNQVLKKAVPQFAANAAGAVKDFVMNTGRFATNLFDKQAAKITFHTAYLKAKNSGASTEQAINFADGWVDKIHADISKLGRSDSSFLQSSVGKAFSQFQTFTLNLASTISTDIPHIIRTEGAANGIASMLKAVAGIEIANTISEETGIPKFYDVTNFVPFMNTFKYGIPGYYGLMQDLYVSMADEKSRKKAFSKENLAKTGLMLSVPGGLQLNKSVGPAFKAATTDVYEDRPGALAKDVIWGKKAAARARVKKRSAFDRARRDLTDSIRENLP